MQNYWLSGVNYQKSSVKNINEMKHEPMQGTVAPAEREFADSLLAIAKKQQSIKWLDNRGRCAVRTNIRVMKIWKRLRPYALKIYYLFAVGAQDFESSGAESLHAKSEFGQLFFNHNGRLIDKWHHLYQ